VSAEASSLLRDGEAALKRRDFAAASAALARAVELVPALAPAHALLGRARHAAGDLAGALAAFEVAKSLGETGPDLERRRANLLLDLDRADDAARGFRAALARAPNMAGAWYGLGTALAELDDVAGASDAFERWGEIPGPGGVDRKVDKQESERQIRLDDAFFAGLPVAPGALPAGDYAQGDAPLIFAAADAGYAVRFAELLSGNLAARAPGIGLHLHVVNPTHESEAKLARIRDLSQGHLELALTRETTDLSRFEGPQTHMAAKTYFTCARFLALPALLAHYRRPILVCDIDLAPTRDPRPWLDELAAADAGANVKIRYDFANHLLATMVYVGDTPAGRDFARLVAGYCRHFLDARQAAWTLDQVALRASYLHLRRQGVWRDFRVFAPGTMNWMDDAVSAEEAQRRFLFVSLYSSVPRG
jgi:tetratricopeptide (TPR) repeat protein